MDLIEAMEGRTSCRAFADTPPPRRLLEEILETAARAPSAVNLQPWKVWVAAGEELCRLKAALLKSYREQRLGCSPGGGRQTPSATDQGPGSFRPLAGAVEARGSEFGAFINEGSCRLYGAPAGVFCFVGPGQPAARQLDCGVWLGYFLLAAHARGLATCPVGLLAEYAAVVREALFVPEDYTFACAAAVGYALPDDPVNRFRCARKGTRDVEWLL